MTTLVVLAVSLIGYPMVSRQFSMLEQQFTTTGNSLAQQVATSAVTMVFSEDDLALGNLVRSTGEQTHVVSVILVNKDFEITQSEGPRPSINKLKEDSAFTEPSMYTDNDKISWFSAPILFNGVSGGSAWIGLNKAPLLQNQVIVVSSAFTLVGILVLSIIWIAIRISRKLSTPINDLILAAQAIDQGKFSYRLQSKHTDEFAALNDAFNTMAAGLEQKLRVEKNFSRFVSMPVASHYMGREDSEMTMQGERVDASIIFVDLVNYTGFSEQYSPEIVADVLNFYFSEFSTACHQFNGNVDKFIGDCAMLVFGCPQSDPDHPKHSLECSIYIRNRIKQLNTQRTADGLPALDIRIGLAGGTLLAGLLGSEERLNYSVIGEAVNLAARLCDKAPTGGILTDKNFLASLGSGTQVSCHETQTITVKGFSQDIDTLVIDDFK